MAKYPRTVPAADVRRVLKELGFREVRQTGSHLMMVQGSRTTCIPIHANADLPVGTFRDILRQSGITRAEFFKRY